MSFDVEATSNLQVNGRDLGIINGTDLPTETIAGDPSLREIASTMSRWVENTREGSRGSLFERVSYTPPNNAYDEMKVARQAVRTDSVVSGVAETTEAFAFQGVKWEGEDADEADVFNQLSRDMNLDAVVRKMWRDEFQFSQFVAAKIWGYKTYTVRGKTKNGNRRKRTFRIWAPLQIRTLDSLKVVPCGIGPLGGETLCWQATRAEIGHYTSAYQGEVIDPLMTTFFQGSYIPTSDEVVQLTQLGVDVQRLLAMNPEWVFRHTVTKADYERFPDIRLKSIFALLDLKQHLMDSDRATLIGAAKYILLIRKGEKDAPALPEEMANLRENYQFIAKLPVIISDHRLSIDIIAPKTDLTLDENKYGVLDQRIISRLLGSLTVGSNGGRQSSTGADQVNQAIARVMENRRHMLKRTLEYEIGRAVVEHPKNAGVFETQPSLVYTPRNISLTMADSYTQALMALRTQREISRETILEFFGLDEATEAQRMELEEEFYDEIFKTAIPFNGQPGSTGVQPPTDKPVDAPDDTRQVPARPARKAVPATPNGTPEAPAVSGARGGRPRGGGKTPQSPQAQTKPRTSNGNPST